MASYKSYTIPAPNSALECQENDLQQTIENLPSNGGLVKVRFAGVCHTDIHYYEGGYTLSAGESLEFKDRPGLGYPKVPGHEVCGEVYALGTRVALDDSAAVKVGDLVCVFAWMGCDECEACSVEETAHCTGGSREMGISIDGGYAQFVVVPHFRYLLPLPAKVPMELGCTLSCGCLTAYTACKTAIANVPDLILKTAPCLRIAVIGLGGVGQWALKLLPLLVKEDLRYRNSRCTLHITGVDCDDARLDRFLENTSITDKFVFDRSKPSGVLAQELLGTSDGFFHSVIDFVNNPATFSFGNTTLRKFGVLIAVGLFGGSGEVCLPLLALQRQKIIGIQTGSLRDFKELLTFLNRLQNTVEGPSIIVYPLSECMKALNDLKEGRVKGRAVLKCFV